MNSLTHTPPLYPITDRWHCSTYMGDGGFEWRGNPLDALSQWAGAVAHLYPGIEPITDYSAVARLLVREGSWRFGDEYTGITVTHPRAIAEQTGGQ